MTRAAIEEFLERHKAAFARRDVDALTEIHTADGTLVRLGVLKVKPS